MILRNGEVEIDGEDEFEDMPALEEVSDHGGTVEFAPVGKLMVTMRALNTQVKADDTEQQWENIFHTRCHVHDKVCSIIIDGGSCTNIASTTLVEKLVLVLIKHPRPYKLQWLNDSGEVRVNKQVVISFSIGGYSDKIVCDVVPMQAGHILLGRACSMIEKLIIIGIEIGITLSRREDLLLLRH